MSIQLVLRRTEPGELEWLLESPDDRWATLTGLPGHSGSAFDFDFEEAEFEVYDRFMDDERVNRGVGKKWDYLARTLRAIGRARPELAMAAESITGGAALGSPLDYGPVMYHRPQAVSAIASVLRRVDDDDLITGWDGGDFDDTYSGSSIGQLAAAFEELRSTFWAAAASSEAVLYWRV